MCIWGFKFDSHETYFSLSRAEAIQRKEFIYFFLELDSAVIDAGSCSSGGIFEPTRTSGIWMEFRDTITIFDSIIGKRLKRISPRKSYHTRFESSFQTSQHIFTGNVVWGIESNEDVIEYMNEIMQAAIGGNYDAQHIIFREFSKDRIFNLIKGIYYERTAQDIAGFPMFFVNMLGPTLCAYFGLGDLKILRTESPPRGSSKKSVYTFRSHKSVGDFSINTITTTDYSYSPVVDIYFNVGEVIWEFSDIIQAFPRSVTDKWYREVSDFILHLEWLFGGNGEDGEYWAS